MTLSRMKQNRPDIGAIFEVAVGMSAGDKPGYSGDDTELLQGVGMPGDCALVAPDHTCYGGAFGAAESGVQGEIDDGAQYAGPQGVLALPW